MCFQQGIVPKELKRANIIPIHKGNDPTIFSNYRPISLLPVFSKILERLLYNRLFNFFNSNNIQGDSQYGFRRGFSTEMALADTLNRITCELDEGNSVIGLFLDLKKAFDTVNFVILLRKLEFYGVRGIALDLLRNYLSHRCQRVSLNGHLSVTEVCSCGVPQGSILGPLLFLVYINDLPNALDEAFTIMYADDTNIFMRGRNVDLVTIAFNRQLVNLNKWLQCNRLSLNLSKTKSMIFSLNHQTRGRMLSLSFDGTLVDTITSTTFLGVKIDNSLTWSNHISHVCSKIAKSIGILKKVSNIFNQATLLGLYNSFILPYLNYCNIIWGNAAEIHLKRILILQKRAVRIICKLAFLDHCDPAFSTCQILKIKDLFTFSTAIFFFKINSNLFPPNFSISIFSPILTTTDRGHDTRGTRQHRFILPRCRTALRQKSMYYTLPKLHNDLLLPFSLLDCTTVYQFKKNLKTILISYYS